VASLAALGPVAALIGAGEGLFIPASMAIMPSLLTPKQLQAGNALSQVAMQIGTFIGPVVGGVLVATSGPGPAFAADAASFAGSAITLGMISRRPAFDPGTVPVRGEAVANLAYGGTFEVALPALAHAKFGAGGYGALIACFGAGSVIGSLGAVRLDALRKPVMAACFAYLVTAVGEASVPFLGALTQRAFRTFGARSTQ
jgi:MFS family permease